MDFSFSAALQRQQEAKALIAHPAFMADTPVGVYAPGGVNPREDAKLSQREARRHMDAYGGRQAIDWVYDAIGLYSDPISTAPFRLQSRNDGQRLVEKRTKGTPPDHGDGPPDLYALLKKPNPFMLYSELMSLLVIDLLLVGNAYWYKWQVSSSGKPLAIYRLSPSHVKIKPGPYGPKGYEYQPPGVAQPLVIDDPSQIIHFRRPNPNDTYYGMGVIQGAGRSMDLELAVTDTMASYYENKADPSMIVASERRVPRDVFNKLRAQMRARVSGTKRAGELLVLEAGLKATSLSTSASDALFDRLGAMSRDRVWGHFRANPKLFGIMDESGGSDKVSDARREFDNGALRPFMSRLQEAVSDGLTSLWDTDYIVEYATQLDPDAAVKVGGQIAAVPGIKVREIRRQYAQFGIEESTGDPKVDEMILNLPTPELDANGQPIVAGKADRNLPTEAGRPPLGKNTVAFPSGAGKKAFGDIVALLEAKALVEPTPPRDSRLPGEVRPDDTFATVRETDINAARDLIAIGLRDAAAELERELISVVDGKALKQSDIVKRVKTSAAWKTFQQRVEEVIRTGAEQVARSAVMHSNLTHDEEIDYDGIVDAIVKRPEGVRGIVNTLKTRVAARISAARDANAERSEYQTALRAVLSEWADTQAETVGDSEATEAYNESTLTSAEMAGVQSLYVLDGTDSDPECADANGSIWDVATARKNRKQHPRCRRAFIALTAEAVTS